jgi:hypothetical protein
VSFPEDTSRIVFSGAMTLAHPAEKGEALQTLVEFVLAEADGYEIVDIKKLNVFGSDEVDLSIHQEPAGKPCAFH